MSSFLRQLSLSKKQQSSTIGMMNKAMGQESEAELSLLESLEALNLRNEQIRERYARLLLCCDSKLRDGVMLTVNGINDSQLQFNRSVDEKELEMPLKSLIVAAPPSGNAAHYLARTMILSLWRALSTRRHLALWVSPMRNESELISVSLSAIFSVLLELNRRDPSLCIQALQSLLGLLQNLPPETFGQQSHSMVLQMHNLLKALRLEGNSQVSEYVNSCMISLATAYGIPELSFATISALLCESNRNVPFNQQLGNCNLIPRNFQRLALTVQRTVQRGPVMTSRSTKFNWWSRPLTDHSQIAEFELVFPGCLSPSDIFESNQNSSTVQGSICSDGFFVYILSIYGIFKMGTGLTETRAGKVFAHNEHLRYIDGSSLIYCNESLYLRRSHSTRLWVIERESLREIGEIMLPTSLCDGVLYSDGRLFYHGILDDQWNFVSTPLDDNFAQMQNLRNHQRLACRLVDIEYSVFGDFGQKLRTLIDSIPPHLKSMAVDLQFGNSIGFLLTRTGKVYHGGNGEAFGLTSSTDFWIQLQTTEPIVAFVLDSHCNCLVMRAGSGHLYALGSLSNIFDSSGQQRPTTQRIRKIRIPDKRKCTSIAGSGGAMAFAVESGQCFLHGRHIVNAHAETYAAFGLDRVAVASVGLGKTHLVVIARNGLVYTAGLNNLGQCGRSANTTEPQKPSTNTQRPRSRSASPSANWCSSAAAHLFVKDVATICARCGFCSSKGRECPYGGGLQVKTTIGSAVTGTTESTDQEHVYANPQIVNNDDEEEDATTDDVEILNQSLGDDNTERAPRLVTDAMLLPGRVVLTSEQNEIKVATVSVGNYHTILLCADHQVFTFGSNCNGQLGVGDATKRSGPIRVNLPANVQVVQAVAGGNHCVLRTVNGEVLTFGAYRSGQLGRKAVDLENDRFWFARPDFVSGFGPEGNQMASWIGARGDRTFIQSHRRLFSRQDLNNCQVAANRDCVALIPFAQNDSSTPLNCAMIPTRSTSSSSTSTFHQFAVNFTSSCSWCFDPIYDLLWSFDAEKFCVLGYSDAPRQNVELINNDLEPPFFRTERQLLQSTELCVPAANSSEADGPIARFSDAQLAVFMLSTTYGLSLSALAVIPTSIRAAATEDNKTERLINQSANGLTSLFGENAIVQNETERRSRGDSLVDVVTANCSVIGRFETFGGGWGYSAHCVEAVEFRVNRDITLHGLGLFGGRGENTARIKIFRRPTSTVVDLTDADAEESLELLAETPETLFECASREIAFIGFAPAVISAHVWHIAWVQIHGTSSDCGAEGQSVVKGDGEVEWQFRNSAFSNNGTDVESGQIPEFFYRLRSSIIANAPFNASRLSVGSDGAIGVDRHNLTSDVSLSAQTVFTVTPATLRHLFRILEWAIRGSFLLRDYDEMQNDVAASRQERAAFVAIVSLRMIRIYLGILFPNQRTSQRWQTNRSDTIECVECVVEFHVLLDDLFQVADEKLFFEDRIGALMVSEAVDVYVACAHLFVPSPLVLAIRFGDTIARCARNWRVLAMLRAFCRLEAFILPILGIQNRTQSQNSGSNEARQLAERLASLMPEHVRAATSTSVIRYVFELAFVVTEIKTDDLLTDRLRAAAQDLVLRMANKLVFSQSAVKQPPTIFQTSRRFRQIVSHPDWEMGQEHDAIGFKVDRPGIVLQGVGMFTAVQQNSRRVSTVIEIFEAKDNSHGESWSLLSKTTGATGDIFNQTTNVEADHWTVPLRLSTPIALQPNVVYAIRVQSDAGKTRYGESGVATVRLNGTKNGRLTFLPCTSLSRNGTTVSRGQLPFLLYSVEEEALKLKNKQNRRCGSLTANNSANQKEETNRLFLLIIRLLATKLSVLITAGVLQDGANFQSTCSQLVALANVFIQLNPKTAFEVVAAFDGVLPLITAANADVAEATEDERTSKNGKQRETTYGSMVNEQSACSTRSTGGIQAMVESAHPYLPHSLQTHVVRFECSIEFVSIRFHDECQTAHVDDALWIYGQLGDDSNTAVALFPVGRFSTSKDWPDGVILVPGRVVWFVFESGAARDDLDVTKQYGFRCTVEGITANHSTRGSASIASLEQEFAWLCSTACNLIVRSTLRDEQSESENKSRRSIQLDRELIQRHGGLLQKGLNLSTVPTLAQINQYGTPKLNITECKSYLQIPKRFRLALHFLADFIASKNESDGGLLSQLLIVEPFVDVSRCHLEVSSSDFTVGRPVNLRLKLRTQYDENVKSPPADMQIELIVRRGALPSRSYNRNADSARILRSLTIFNDLVQTEEIEEEQSDDDGEWRRLREIQKTEPYRPFSSGSQSRFISINAQPIFSSYSLEEMRWAFELGATASETLKLPANLLETTWTPTAIGRYHVEARIDGFDCANRADFNIRPTTPTSSTMPLVVPPTPVHRPRQRNLAAPSTELKTNVSVFNRATCPLVSCYSGARIRSHPTLSATIIGGLPRGASVRYVETQRNTDGIWLRLSDDVRGLYVDRRTSIDSAWVLQYNRHLKMEHLILVVVNGNNVEDDESKIEIQRTAVTSLHSRRSKYPSVISKSLTVVKQETVEDDEGNPPTDVFRPSTVECFRAVFAAFIWHEQLVTSLQECVREIRFNNIDNIPVEIRDSFHDSNFAPYFLTLQHARRLWSSITAALRVVVYQQLILPTPPQRRSRVFPRIATVERLATDASNDSPVRGFGFEGHDKLTEPQNPDEICELCGEMHSRPITIHMRTAHPGCGESCFGHGYNSVGGYSTGWSGICGEGGRGNAIWYLLCPNCRTAALKQKQNLAAPNHGASLEAADDDVDRRWSEFRLLTAAQQLRPEIVMRRNAIFLLGLSPNQRSNFNESSSNKQKGRANWTIEMHPMAGTFTPPSSFVSAATGTTILSTAHNPTHSTVAAQASHTSDPGVSNVPAVDSQIISRVPTSLSASANVFQRPTANFLSTIGPLAEEDIEDETALTSGPPVGSANAHLAELSLRLSSLVGTSPTNALQQQSVLAFVVENHDLQAVRQSFDNAIRRAVALTYAFRLWNWLLKLVTAESSVMDIVWQYLNTMHSLIPFIQSTSVGDIHFATRLRLLPHPLRLCFLAGDLVTSQMVRGMHAFLQTLYVILRADEVDIRLKCLCFRAWTFQLTTSEQNLLYTLCKLLCSVCDVLADNSADNSLLMLDESLLPSTTPASCGRPSSSGVPNVKQLEDVSSMVKVTATSQRNLIACLTDGSAETFWESGDEDINHLSRLNVSWDLRQCNPTILGIYIDQVRDSSYRLSQVTIGASERLNESKETKTLQSTIVNARFVGWIRCCVIGCESVSINLKFNGRSCRVRQLSLLGQNYTATAMTPIADQLNKTTRPPSAHQLSFSSAQMDAFALFQAVAAQVFNDEFAKEENGTLRQQVLDMLFNRVQLQPLQSNVCTQIVTAVEREIVNLRERKKRNFSYVCGLMVMLIKICESRKGLEVFSMRSGLLIMLSELLLFAPQIVELQVIETIERLLKHFRPSTVDCATFVQNLLAVISKTISLQIKDKLSHKMSSATLLTYTTDIPTVWRADRPITSEVVQLVVHTLSAMANGSISSQWTTAIRTELANNVMALTKLLAASGFLPPSSSSTDFPSTSFSTTTDSAIKNKAILFLRNPQFWLSVSALSTIVDPSWLEMSNAWRTLKARKSKEPESFCENHDDGVTLARFHCEMCQLFLCYECFTILHLNKKKKGGHAAKLVGTSNMCPQINVHEGCTRLRLSNLLILFNCAKLSGVVELGAEMATTGVASSASTDLSVLPTNSTTILSGTNTKCRFCTNPLRADGDVQNGTCSYNECRKLLKDACTKILSCGHWCSGIRNEQQCLPCFNCPTTDSRQDGDDLCVICFTDRLGGAPCIRVGCGHFFHFGCVRTVLEKRWNGPRIVFRFMQCPLCKQTIEHQALESLLAPLRALYEDVTKKAVLRLEYDGLLKSKPITSTESEYFENPTGYALDHYVYVLCSKCGKAYFGGESRCQEALDSSTYQPDELVCGACSDIAGAPVCGRHGTEFLEYKCKFCCSVAVYFCFGNSHFCSGCHSDFQRLMALPVHLLPQCPTGPRATTLEGVDQCPLRVQHPPTGEEFSLGCGICRNLTTF
ncbi:RCR-type E3 ubiquitin transferase [Aphelenchoides besseyi]|nr:RCR-type E3 ubiquitin transferase [Aphelenchoides besseyi]